MNTVTVDMHVSRRVSFVVVNDERTRAHGKLHNTVDQQRRTERVQL
jgi:hypothetical protein